MSVNFEVSDVVPAPVEEVYAAWLDSGEHAAMTGSPAEVSGVVGGEFEAWDGYIRGQNLELDPPRRILQLWRTVEFEPSDADSRLEILFDPIEEGTRITLHHTKLPEHGSRYRQGWRDSYFTPMKEYFAAKSA